MWVAICLRHSSETNIRRERFSFGDVRPLGNICHPATQYMYWGGAGISAHTDVHATVRGLPTEDQKRQPSIYISIGQTSSQTCFFWSDWRAKI